MSESSAASHKRIPVSELSVASKAQRLTQLMMDINRTYSNSAGFEDGTAPSQLARQGEKLARFLLEDPGVREFFPNKLISGITYGSEESQRIVSVDFYTGGISVTSKSSKYTFEIMGARPEVPVYDKSSSELKLLMTEDIKGYLTHLSQNARATVG